MTFHFGSLFNVQSLILAGVVVHLVASAAKALVKSPKQKAQIDAIEGKVDDVLTQVSRAVPTLGQAILPAAAASEPPPLSLALQSLPSSQASANAQGGAS